MGPAETIREARRRAGLPLRAMAVRAGVEPAKLEAYESGAEVPDPDTLDWIVACADFDRGEELAALLELAEQFPVRFSPTLEYPVFGR